MKKVVFVIPMFNASQNLDELMSSILDQTSSSWEAIFIDDMSTDNSALVVKKYAKQDDRIKLIKNKEKKWALRNVVEASRKYQDEDVIIAILDADDALCNENTVNLLIDGYSDSVDTVWTSHTWDINGLNISKPLPNNEANPYQVPWCTSHLKTFRSSLMKKISDDNFKDLNDEWFIRGYDQALYLPLLYLSNERKHIDEICYLYKINSVSLQTRDWNEKIQMDTVRLVRARGFIDNA